MTREDRYVLLLTAGVAMWNMGAGYFAGLALWHLFRRGWLCDARGRWTADYVLLPFAATRPILDAESSASPGPRHRHAVAVIRDARRHLRPVTV